MARRVSLGSWRSYIPRSFENRQCPKHPPAELTLDDDGLARCSRCRKDKETPEQPVIAQIMSLSAHDYGDIIDVAPAELEQDLDDMDAAERRIKLRAITKDRLFEHCVGTVSGYEVIDHRAIGDCDPCGVEHTDGDIIVIDTGRKMLRHGEVQFTAELSGAVALAQRLKADLGEASG